MKKENDIIAVAGNPETGVIKELADAWADAIVGLDETKDDRLAKETRVTKPSEIR